MPDTICEHDVVELVALPFGHRPPGLELGMRGTVVYVYMDRHIEVEFPGDPEPLFVTLNPAQVRRVVGA